MLLHFSVSIPKMSSPSPVGAPSPSRKEREQSAASASLQRVSAASKLKGAAKKVAVLGSLTNSGHLDGGSSASAIVSAVRRKKDEVVKHKKGWRGSPVHYACAAGRLDLLVPIFKEDVEHEIGELF